MPGRVWGNDVSKGCIAACRTAAAERGNDVSEVLFGLCLPFWEACFRAWNPDCLPKCYRVPGAKLCPLPPKQGRVILAPNQGAQIGNCNPKRRGRGEGGAIEDLPKNCNEGGGVCLIKNYAPPVF